eukprot:GFUD01015275.1.p1 GENE.GFUD01015275.1~~GFUD01015275.1.p1  ORF type:complete len:118 (-),score=24.44 GFUD01015275.1:95-448(-)
MLFHYLVLLLVPLSVAGAAGDDDPCYQEGTNCYWPGENEIGHTPYLQDIWACELACQDTSGCVWFTWFQQSGFYMCYLLTECPKPFKDDKSVSAKIEDCTPDTTPTRRPTWTPPHEE